MKRSFMTSLPDKSGAFLQASRIILAHGGNMVRASYNKAVDAHTLFVDVEGEEKQKLTVEDLLKLFAKASGKEFSSDRAILG